MSGLSPEALASLGGLNLQDVKADLRFSPAEKKKPLTVELDWLEKTSIQFWNFDTVLEKLNALGTKTTPRENVVFPKAEEDIPSFWKGLAREDEGPDWLMSPFPAAEEAPSSQRQEWNALSLAQQENDLFRWSDKFKRGEPIEDWQLQAVKDNRIYLGDAEESSSPQTEELTPREAWMALPEDQRGRDLQRWKLKKYLGEPLEYWQEKAIEGQEDEGEERIEEEPAETEAVVSPKNEKLISERFGKLKEFIENYNWGRLARDGVHVLVPLLSGALATTILSPDQAHNLIVTAFGVGSAGFLGAGACAITEKILPRHLKTGRLASSLAVLRVTGAVFAEAGILMGVGATSGVALHAREAFDSGMKLLNDDVLPAGNNNHTGTDSNPQFGGTSPDVRGEVVVKPPAGGGVGPEASPLTTPDAPTIKPPDVDPNANGASQLDNLRQQLVNSLPHNIKVANLLPENQIGTSHWKLAELWTKPLGDNFGLSDAGRTFFTDVVKDITQDQGNVRLDTIVNYDSGKIGDYLSQALGRLKETDPAGWNVKVAPEDIEKMYQIADLLKNAK